MENRVDRIFLELTRLDGGGVPIFHYKGKPFTGTVIYYYEDGTLWMEEEYKKGYQEGWVRCYHPNGRLAQEDKLHNNITISGTYKEWDENGNLIESF
jgi:antitoxin component YwqK of YwqJK toxin-antitoxin module